MIEELKELIKSSGKINFSTLEKDEISLGKQF